MMIHVEAAAYPITLRCDECDQDFIRYDPTAERGHGFSPHDLLIDASRHAEVCGESE